MIIGSGQSPGCLANKAGSRNHIDHIFIFLSIRKNQDYFLVHLSNIIFLVFTISALRNTAI